jgi:hypothetical protein
MESSSAYSSTSRFGSVVLIERECLYKWRSKTLRTRPHPVCGRVQSLHGYPLSRPVDECTRLQTEGAVFRGLSARRTIEDIPTAKVNNRTVTRNHAHCELSSGLFGNDFAHLSAEHGFSGISSRISLRWLEIPTGDHASTPASCEDSPHSIRSSSQQGIKTPRCEASLDR